MKKIEFIALAAAAMLALPLTLGGCNGTTSDTPATGGSTEEQSSSDFDAAAFYTGQWRASVETSGNSVYGNVSGTEPMLDVICNEDGTCSVEPVEGHEDLLTAEGTWEGTESQLTLSVDGKEIVIDVVSDTALEGDPTDFGIEGFDTLDFVLW